MKALSANQVRRLRKIRCYVARHPGSSCKEIYAATALAYGVQLLLERKLICARQRPDGKPGYHIREMGPCPEDPQQKLPHPDKCLLDEPNHERVGCQ